MKIKDIISLKKDVIFGGAVQTEWFYEEKAKVIAENFVFHGPDFFGVTDEDVEFKAHKLMDTCTYANMIANKLYSEDGNPIVLTIAGYGTGKSHLSVTLGSLFSANKTDGLFNKIIGNIERLNSGIAKEIKEKHDKPNLVLVINGMKDFNLNYEILNTAKKSLRQKGYGEEIFSEFTKAYNIAYKFLEKNYDLLKDDFLKISKENGIEKSDLKAYLKENIYTDIVFDSINEVYKEFTGDYIRWDDGVSSSEILKKLTEKLCGDKGEFNKILILFDEFGRYIEYASEYPNRAGDSALQQLFEAIQDADNKIIFNAFIQSDLKTYLSRVNKTSNISRYIGRYESGEKIYLSSNLETIFANLINKTNKDLFNQYIKGYFEKTLIEEKQKNLFNGLNRWINNVGTRGVWKNYDKYKEIILEGIYPLDPIATWLITDLSDWYQQRSALNFLMKSFNDIEEKELHEFGDIPRIKAVDIINGDLFTELLLAEEEGRQKSEYCIVYDRLKIRYKDKLNKYELNLLSGILILKLCKFRTKTSEDLLLALESITGLEENLLKSSINTLEEDYGIIGFDERNCTYDFIEDATGKNDFLRLLRRKRNNIKVNSEDLIGAESISLLGISDVIESRFSKFNYIKSNEWNYTTSIIHLDNISELYINNMIKDFIDSTSPEITKGRLVYIYLDSDYSLNSLENFKNLYNKKSLNKYPFIFMLLDDRNNTIKEGLILDRVCKLFTQDEKMKFSKYIDSYVADNTKLLKDTLKDLTLERMYITQNGVEKIEERLVKICDKRFEELYPDIIPFDFTNFENKKLTVAKKAYIQIAKLLIQDSINYQTISTLPQDIVNRIKSVLENPRSGWGVLSNNSNIIKLSSPKNNKVKKIFDILDHEFYENKLISFEKMLKILTKPPYGLNDFSALLLLLVYTINKKYECKISLNKQIINNIEWSKKVFTEKNTILYSIINNTEIIKIDVDGYKLKYQKLCAEIESNTDMNLCENLNNQLEQLILEAEIPDIFKEKVEGCKIILKEGIKLKRKIVEEIGAAEAKLDNSIEKEDYKKLIELALYIEERTISTDSERFIYSEEYINKFQSIGEVARSVIEEKFELYINSNKSNCRSLEQVTGYETWMKNMSSNLRKLGYNDLSRITLNKKDNEINNLQFMREVKNVEIELNNYLGKQINNLLTQEELLFLDKEGKRLSKNLAENNKLRDIDKIRLNKNLIEKQKSIDSALKEIADKLIEIYNISYELNNIEELKSLKGKITYILSKKLKEEDKQDIEEMADEIQNFLNKIDEINKEDNLDNRILLIEELEKNYEDVEVITLSDVINDIKAKIILEKDNKIKIWNDNNLSIDREEIDKFTSNDCYSWLDKTNILPDYLDNISKETYENIRLLVENRLKELKIESIVVLFENLTEDEKKLCISTLNEII